jgi:hypothetical protein
MAVYKSQVMIITAMYFYQKARMFHPIDAEPKVWVLAKATSLVDNHTIGGVERVVFNG